MTTPVLYNASGDPIVTERAPVKATKEYGAYITSLFGLDHPPIQRARDPLSNHAWVYIAAMIRATNLAQAPLLLFTETEDTLAKRRDQAIRRNGYWHGPRAGKSRTAVHRHLTRRVNPMRFRGLRLKGLEPDYEHEISRALLTPNPAMSQAALIQITSLWLSLRGEVFWVKIKEDGKPVEIGEAADEIWPVSPDLFDPMIVRGRLVGWWFKAQKDSPISGGISGSRIPFALNEVIQFKYPNPKDPYRGITPIAAAASGINIDMMADEHNRALLANGADPGGLLTYDGHLEADEEEAQLEKWRKRHEGPANTRRTAIMKGMWSYTPTGLTPQDMQHLETKRWNREAIFGIMRVPKSTAGVTDDLNYATQVGQDKNLWDKSLLPDVHLIEITLDGTLLFDTPDNVVVAFDLSNIEALRHGLSDQIDQAKKLMAQDVHMPPNLAFEVVGLTEMPEYPGHDKALVSALAVTTMEDLLEVIENPEPEVDPLDPADEEDDEEETDPEDEPEDEPEVPEPDDEEKRAPAIRTSKVFQARAVKSWKDFIRVQAEVEKTMRRTWRSWVAVERERQLEAFDKATKAVDIGTILLPLTDLQERITKGFRPKYAVTLEKTYELLDKELGGILVFDFDDARLIKTIDRRAKILANSAPKTLQKRLRQSLLAGIRSSESVHELRQRVIHVFKMSASPGKTLQIARTESANFMNTARNDMFTMQGIEKLQWTTAGDEHVRATHVWFGKQKAQPIGTDYLALKGYPGAGSGSLTHPGDPNASIEEVSNCRCVHVAV